MEGENGMQEWYASLVYKSGTQGWYTGFPPLSNDFIPFIT